MTGTDSKELLAQPLAHVVLLLNRVAVGWYFMLAGWGKVAQELEGGLGTYVRSDSYQERVPTWLPELAATGHGYALPWVEMIFGAALIFGLFARFTGVVLALTALSITIALHFADQLLPRHHVMLVLAMTLLPVVLGPGRYSIDALLDRRLARATPPADAATEG